MNAGAQGPRAVVVTGASSGIGRALATLCSRRGYRVFAGIRDPRVAEALLEEGGAGLTPLPLDITRREEVLAAARGVGKALSQEGGSLVGLVNNAGITTPGPIECTPLSDFRTAFEVNLVGQMAVVQAFLPLLREGRGRILQVSSALGLFAMPLSGPYAASKYAIEGLTDSLRRELRPQGIPVSLVEPGSVASAIWKKIDTQVVNLSRSMPQEAHALYGGIEDRVQGLWKGMEAAAMPAEKAARVMLRALEARRPAIRYRVGKEPRFLALVSRWIPASIVDGVLGLYLGRAV